MRKLVNLEGTPVTATAVTKELAKTIGYSAIWLAAGFVVTTFAKGFIAGYIDRAEELKAAQD